MSDSLRPHGLYSPWNSPGQNTRVGSLSLFQGIFPTQESNPGLPHCRRILYQLSHQENPTILEWVAYPFSRGSSWLQNQTRVSCIAGGFFTKWAIREAGKCSSNIISCDCLMWTRLSLLPKFQSLVLLTITPELLTSKWSEGKLDSFAVLWWDRAKHSPLGKDVDGLNIKARKPLENNATMLLKRSMIIF